jgi:regulator of sigma E protease
MDIIEVQMDVSAVLQIVKFILVIGVLAFIHELGHFLLSKAFKIEVEEFGLGFPPRLAKLFKWGETEFTLNWIPFGAFVRPKGENDPEVEGGLAAASPGARLAVLFAGPVFNLVLGIFLFAFLFTQTGAPDFSTVVVDSVNEGAPAYEAGLMPGDIFETIDGEAVNSIDKLSSLVRENLGEEISVTFLRNDEQQTVVMTPRIEYPDDQGPIGVVITNPSRPISIIEAIPYSLQTTYSITVQTLMMPANLIAGRINSEDARVIGIVGMYTVYDNAVSVDQENQPVEQNTPLFGLNEIYFIAMISIAFGLTNLLPIPALDGGRILFVLPEILFKKRVPAKYENMVHFIGFAALIMLMFIITFQDIINPIQLP